MSKLTIALMLTVLLSACAGPKTNLHNELRPSNYPIRNKNIFTSLGEHPFCSNIKFASDDFDHYDNAYDQKHKKMAENAFLFAWMSSNVYEGYDRRNPEFRFRDWVRIGDKISTWRGLGAHIYGKRGTDSVIVIAFEGTSSKRDWLFGNFNWLSGGQYREAFKLAKRVRAEFPNAKIITTGHSLGGALAVHVALRIPNVDSYAFNSSVTIRAPRTPVKDIGRISLLSEDDEVLSAFREFFKFREKYDDYNEYDFLNSDTITEHNMYYLARGLTNVAASSGDTEFVELAEDILKNEFNEQREPEICPT